MSAPLESSGASDPATAATVGDAEADTALLQVVEAMLHAGDDVDALSDAALAGVRALLPASVACVLWFADEATATVASARTPAGAVDPDAAAQASDLLRGVVSAAAQTQGRVAPDSDVPADAAARLGLPADGGAVFDVPITATDDAKDGAAGVLVITESVAAMQQHMPRLQYLGRTLGRIHALQRHGRRNADDEADDEVERLRAKIDELDDLGTIVRSIADAVNVAVMFYDTQNHPRLHNRMVETVLKLTGYDPATGMSTHVYASDRRTPVKRDKDIVSETIEGDERGVIYWVGDPDEDEQRAVITEAHRISRPDGVPLGSAVVTYDVTDLANAIDMREEYLTTVSHELRTPLTSIVGYLDVIADNYDIAALGFEREFRIIQRNAEQLATLVRDLASADTREQRLRVEPVDLTALVSQTIGALQPAVDEAGHHLRSHLPTSAMLGRADAARITQVINNLISNAIKYTPRGGDITVSLERDADDALLRVADTGRGMTAGDRARAFDRFFRADDVRDAAIQGVGVGLTIAKTIVDAHGGDITVVSEPGNGSTFTVRLPLRPTGAPLSTVADRL